MSDPRTPDQNGATPWGSPDSQGRQPYPERLGSPAHPQSPYAEPQYPGQHPERYPEQYADYQTGRHTDGYQAPVDEAYPPARRRAPGKPLPEPPAGLAVGAIVAACCLFFVELAGLAIHLVNGDRGDAAAIELGLGVRLDPNGGTVSLLFGLAAYVAACVWLQASRKFAEAANPAARFAHGRAWTWLGWWVPIVSFWYPYQVVRDIRGALAPDGGRRVALGLWWTFWLLSSLRVFNSSSDDTETLVRSVGLAALTVAFIHWMRIVREITTAQEKAAGYV